MNGFVYNGGCSYIQYLLYTIIYVNHGQFVLEMMTKTLPGENSVRASEAKIIVSGEGVALKHQADGFSKNQSVPSCSIFTTMIFTVKV